MEYIRIDELLEEARDIVKNQMPDSNMELSFENMPVNPDDLLIKGNKNLLMIAFENLFENANKFSENKDVKIALQYTDDVIHISVDDFRHWYSHKGFRQCYAKHFSGLRMHVLTADLAWDYL